MLEKLWVKLVSLLCPTRRKFSGFFLLQLRHGLWVMILLDEAAIAEKSSTERSPDKKPLKYNLKPSIRGIV